MGGGNYLRDNNVREVSDLQLTDLCYEDEYVAYMRGNKSVALVSCLQVHG